MQRISSLTLLASLVLLATPSYAQVVVISNTTEERELLPGQSHRGKIRLKNTTTQSQQVKLYQTDYLFAADGATRYDQPGTAHRSNAQWISLQTPSVTLPPAGETTVEYTVTVPGGNGPAVAGTYWSMIMVEGAPAAPSAAAPRNARVQVGLTTVIRYGIQVATHVGGPSTRKAEFTGTRITATRAGSKVLELDVQNTGERGYRPLLRAEVYDQQGAMVGKFESQKGLLYPGLALRQKFELGSLASGVYKVLVVADTGGDDVFGAQYTLKL